MDQTLLGRVGVVYGKTAGILTRETMAATEMVGDLPGIIRDKTTHTVQATGSALRLRKLECTMRKCKRKQLAAFTTAGKTIFALAREHTKNAKRKKEGNNLPSDVDVLFSENRKREHKVRKLRDRIVKIEKTLEKATGYREAILNLNSRMRDVRFAAVRTLEQIGDSNTIPFVVKKLEDPDIRVRRQAAESLHNMIDSMAVSI